MTYLPLAIMSTWVTPIWLLSIGAALGLAVLGAVYGVLRLAKPSMAEAAAAAVRESILQPIFYLAVFLSMFAVVATLVVPYRSIISSVMRLGSVGHVEQEFTIPAATNDERIALPFRVGEVRSFVLESDQPLTVITLAIKGAGEGGMVGLSGGADEVFRWVRPNAAEAAFPTGLTEWSVRNTGEQPAKLRISAETDIEFPEVRVIPLTAVALVSLFAFYFVLRFLMPKVAAIALTTAKESMSQPLFYVVMALGCFALLAFIFIPYNTFGEDVKMLKDSGLTMIMVLSMIVAIWSASVSIADEIEGRTALTLLSKPIGRREFILGKFLGILAPVVIMFVMLGVLFLATISYKMVYDARETAQHEPTWQLCFTEMIRTVPGLVLAFFETVVMAAISVAISTRLPMLANLIVCSSIYVLGHLVPLVVQSSVGKLEIVRFMGQFFATILPVLDHFNIQATVAAGVPVPLSYLGWALLYCLLYSGIAMLLALAMFEDRDLA